MFARGYSLDLYCDGAGCTAGRFGLEPMHATYFGESWAETARAARKHGWRIVKAECKAYCPRCVRERRHAPR